MVSTGDVISFYNKVFVPAMKDFLLTQENVAALRAAQPPAAAAAAAPGAGGDVMRPAPMTPIAAALQHAKRRLSGTNNSPFSSPGYTGGGGGMFAMTPNGASNPFTSPRAASHGPLTSGSLQPSHRNQQSARQQLLSPDGGRGGYQTPKGLLSPAATSSAVAATPPRLLNSPRPTLDAGAGASIEIGRVSALSTSPWMQQQGLQQARSAAAALTGTPPSLLPTSSDGPVDVPLHAGSPRLRPPLQQQHSSNSNATIEGVARSPRRTVLASPGRSPGKPRGSSAGGRPAAAAKSKPLKATGSTKQVAKSLARAFNSPVYKKTARATAPQHIPQNSDPGYERLNLLLLALDTTTAEEAAAAENQ